MKFYRDIFILFFALSCLLKAQNATSTNGFLFVPSAQLNPDRTFSFGVTYFEKNSLSYFDGQYNSLYLYADMTFLPFLSVGINLMRPLNYPKNIYGAGDRSVTFKIKLLNEKEHYVNLLIGLQDALHIINFDTKTNTDFNSSYIALSKKLSLDKNNRSTLEASIGYAKKRQIATFYDMDGIFGGIKLGLFSNYNFLLEYDSRYINAAIILNVVKVVNVMVGTRSGKSFLFSLSHAFLL